MSKSKGRKLAEWLRGLEIDLSGDVKAGKTTFRDASVETAAIKDESVTFAKLHNDAVITASEEIANHDTDTALPTSAAVIDYVASQIATKDNSDEITEGTTNLYFTNERVDDRVNSLLTAGTGITLTYDDTANTLTVAGAAQYGDSDVASYLSTNGYGTSSSIIASITDSAPTTLDTLNELAAALGDDANFSTTTATSLGNRLRIDVNNQNLTGAQQTNALTNLGITATVAELNYVDGVTSNIQTQLNSKGTSSFSGAYADLTGKPTIPTNNNQLTNGAGYAPAANPTFTGNVTAPTLRLTDETDVSLSSTGHAFQIGPTSGINIAMDGNEIAARNNGAASTLYLNQDGGAVYINGVPVTSTLIGQWNTAYGWGNHASAGYYVSSTSNNLATARITWANKESTDVTADGHMAFDLNDTSAPASLGTYGSTHPSGWYFYSGGNLGRFWTDEHFNGTHVSNWQTAYGWGNHATAGYATNLGDLGITSTAAELNKLDGVTATTAELNILDGITATTAELNYVDGVTSNIQTQLNSKGTSNFTGIYADLSGKPNVKTTDATDTGNLWIRNASPTIYFRDTDHRGAMLHNNSNLLYILRGSQATDSTSWATVNGMWPVYWNLTNNDATFGGNITAQYNITAYSSDERLKTNIKPIENAIDKVKQIKGVTFDWNDKADELGFKPETKFNDVGMIAQDLEKVMPQLVKLAPFDTFSPDPNNKEDQSHKMGTSKSGENYKTIQYDRVCALLVEAIKEQQAQIEELKDKLK